jgi:hypothetical protein
LHHTNTPLERGDTSPFTSVLVLLLAINLSACGGGDDGSSAAPLAATSTTSASPTTSTTGGSGAPAVSSGATGAALSGSSTSSSSGGTGSHGAPTAVTKSIRGWTACDGLTDDSDGAASAFDAARNGTFALLVDCPVRLHIASDIARPIFIDDGTTVQFAGAGKFIVDNVLQPAFVIAGSQNVTLTDWNVEYVGGLPVNWDVGGYEQDGQFIKLTGYAQPSMAFNDYRLTPWLAAHRSIVFPHGVTSVWVGATNTSAVFFVTGDVANLNVTGMTLYAPATAGGNRFIPMAFSLSQNYKANQSVTATTAATAQYMAVPHDLEFSNIDLDGTYFGWQGNAQNVSFSNIQSHRYGDLQDANGAQVGGIGKWFAPPHLFYLNYASNGDPALFNKNITISNVVDDGPRVGVARDRGGSDTSSGYALSLKLGCVSCSVSGYETSRPDGFLDILPSSGLTISNVTATYDSAFLNNLYPGWRFPSSFASTGVTMENISIADTASVSIQPPIGGAGQAGNQQLVFKNVSATVNQWAGSGSIYPAILGQGNVVALTYSFVAPQSRMVYVAESGITMTLQAKPDAISTAQTTVLTWNSESTSGCTASGAWTGALQSRGSVVYRPQAGGSLSFLLGCRSTGNLAMATLPFDVTPP